MTTNTESWLNGINDFYESKSPWESIVGYARFIDWPGMENSPDTTIVFQDSSVVPILADGSEENSTSYNANLGTLQRRPEGPPGMENIISSKCFENLLEDTVNPYDGVKVAIPDTFRFTSVRGTLVDKFSEINRVYVVGKKATYRWLAVSPSASVQSGEIPPGSCRVELYIDSTVDMVYELEKGKHYQLGYAQNGLYKDPYIVFANNSHPEDPTLYGSNTSFTLNPMCEAYRSSGEGQYLGSILPTTQVECYLIKQVFAEVALNTPSIVIYDPRKGKAEEIAYNLTYLASPIVIIDEPAPVAFNGMLLDLSQMEQDHDPTVPQDFINTDYEAMFDTMDGGAGLTLSMSFLEKEQARKLSEELYNLMISDNGSITVYVCSPDSEPQLGGYGPDSDSVVNEINYSYSDSSAYTISVACGPKIIGDFASISSGPAYKAIEAVSAGGTVISDA